MLIQRCDKDRTDMMTLQLIMMMSFYSFKYDKLGIQLTFLEPTNLSKNVFHVKYKFYKNNGKMYPSLIRNTKQML